MVCGFCAGKVKGAIPDACFSGRRLELGMIVGSPLVIFSGCKFFPCPIQIIEADRLSGRLTVKKGKLGEDGLDHAFSIFAPQCRDADKSGQPIGPVCLTGSVMNLPQGATQAEPLAGKADLPPIRLIIQGKKFCLSCHPGACF